MKDDPNPKSKAYSLAIEPEDNVTVSLVLNSGEEIIEQRVKEISGDGLSFDTLESMDKYKDMRTVKIYFQDDLLGQLPARCETSGIQSGNFLKRVNVFFMDKAFHFSFPHKFVERVGGHYIRPRQFSDIEQIILVLISKPEDMVISLLETEEDKEEIYRFRFKQYSEIGKVDETIFPGGRLVDKFDPCSTVLQVRIYGKIIATIRITYENDVEIFELEEDYKGKIREDGYKYAEISRLCVDKFFRGSFAIKSGLYVNLFIEVYKHCLKNGVERLILSALKNHRHLYGSFGFKVISEEFTMEHFRFSYFLMLAETNKPDSIPNAFIREKFRKVYEEVRLKK